MRKLLHLLRQGAIENNMNIEKDGYIKLDEVIQFLKIDINKIQEIITKDKIDRFNIKEENGQFFIRANKGHLFPIFTGELKEIKSYPFCFYATDKLGLKYIKKNGLKPTNFKYVFFITETSMVKKGAYIWLELNILKAKAAGIKFYKSDNGIIFTESIIEFKYLRMIY